MDNTVKNKSPTTEDDSKETEMLLDPSQQEEIISQTNGQHATKNHLESSTEQRNQSISLHFRVMRVSLYMLHKLLDVVMLPVFIYRMFEMSRRCTKVTDELLMIPVSELTKRIRKKEVSCETVMKSYIARIKEVNPLLNAVIDERYAEAIAEAKLVDQLLSSKEFLNDEESIVKKYPLLGVPLTVKGSIAVKGLKYTSGMVTRKDVIAKNDAVTVDQARNAGAIPLLVSNVPELCMNWETFNNLIGTTKNPFDSTRTCGGSSGGEASLLGAGASLIGIGSDIAGSLRLPAHNCGIWGHKPTAGAVSDEGHYPNCSSREQWEATFTLGPMARYAGDLKILLDVISKPEKKEQLRLGEKVDVRKLKFYYTDMEDFYWRSPNKACRNGLKKVVSYLETVCDTPPQKVDINLLQYATELATFTLAEIDNLDYIFDSYGNGFYSELLRFITFRSKHNLSTISYGLMKKINLRIPQRMKEKVRKNVEELRRDFEKTLGTDGVFLLPSFPIEAIKHGDWLRLSLASGYLSIFSVLGFPVTNCPVSATKEGVPVGIQVVSLRYADRLTLSVAEEIEEAFGGWRSPEA